VFVQLVDNFLRSHSRHGWYLAKAALVSAFVRLHQFNRLLIRSRPSDTVEL
jgi:hypothetical protein